MTMTLQQMAQIGEFLGGLSVLLTLIYLAIQIRGNTKAVRSAGAQQTHDSMIQGYRQLAGDRELNRVFRIGTDNIDSLTNDDNVQTTGKSQSCHAGTKRLRLRHQNVSDCF